MKENQVASWTYLPAEYPSGVLYCYSEATAKAGKFGRKWSNKDHYHLMIFSGFVGKIVIRRWVENMLGTYEANEK